MSCRGSARSLIPFLFTALMAPPLAATLPAGIYTGTTSQNQPISVTVGPGDAILGWQVGYNCPAFSSIITVSLNPCVIQPLGQFLCGNLLCSPLLPTSKITGTVDSGILSGTVEISHQPGLLAPCCATGELSFTASLPGGGGSGGGGAGTLSPVSASLSIVEHLGGLAVAVHRGGGTSGAVSIDYTVGGAGGYGDPGRRLPAGAGHPTLVRRRRCRQEFLGGCDG